LRGLQTSDEPTKPEYSINEDRFLRSTVRIASKASRQDSIVPDSNLAPGDERPAVSQEGNKSKIPCKAGASKEQSYLAAKTLLSIDEPSHKIVPLLLRDSPDAYASFLASAKILSTRSENRFVSTGTALKACTDILSANAVRHVCVASVESSPVLTEPRLSSAAAIM
jgi:hypothetical protein